MRERMQREGGPRDETLYSCGCGYDFTAAVVASVRCPRCDACLAW